MLPAVLKIIGIALLSFVLSANAQAQEGVTTARRARSERAEPPRETDANAVEIRARGEVLEVVALTDVEIDHNVDLHRQVLSQNRRARRYSLCTTPCRLVIDRPLLLDVEGIDVPIAPESQRQRWLVLPERTQLRTAARVLAAAGFVSLIVGLVYFSWGNRTRSDAFTPDSNAQFRGGVAGIVLGSALFVGGVTAARLLRGRATRVY